MRLNSQISHYCKQTKLLLDNYDTKQRSYLDHTIITCVVLKVQLFGQLFENGSQCVTYSTVSTYTLDSYVAYCLLTHMGLCPQECSGSGSEHILELATLHAHFNQAT